jgi:adenine-specific DNA methylase
MAAHAENEIQSFFARIPFGSPSESLPGKEALGFRVPLYGFDEWQKLFSPRQLLALGTVLMAGRCARQELKSANYPTNWIEAISAYLALILDKAADYNSMVCTWHNSGEKIGHTYARFALPITWDFAELALPNEVGGAYLAQLDWVARYVDHALTATAAGTPRIILQSATQRHSATADVVITDPPYYDAIPYSDAMDFFYVWLRRMLNGLSSEIDSAFNEPLGPKWDHQKMDGELIDDPSRFDGDQSKSKEVYEEGMFRAFQVCSDALKPEGRMVVVFANKQPAAWETLVSAIIRAGFLVDGSWPIQTEMTTRTRARSSAALSSSVWLVCRKRPITSRPGWDNRVLDEMRGNIATQLREFWDAGIRGPDFVWAATGPALESYSKYPAVKKARDPGKLMEVSEFLRQVRRIVVDFVVGQVLSPDKEGSEATGLDDATTYYLLHRHDFGMEDTPAGPCILYAVSCNLSDAALADQFDILARTGGTEAEEDDGAEESEEEEPDSEIEEGSGSRLRLKQWYQRTNPMMGYDPSVDSARARADAMQMKLLEEEKEPPRRRQIPLIDQVHRLMHLWKSGDRAKVDDYLEVRALVRHKTFLKLLQALIELSPQASDERSLLEKISNHIAARGGTDQMVFDTSTQEQAR